MTAPIHSRAEQLFQIKTGYEKIDNLLPFTFVDKNGTEYKAKGDFILNDPRLPGLVIEYKSGRLNSLTCKQSSINAIERAQGSTRGNFSYLQTGYNHSLYCKSEMQETINPLWYLVVFKTNPAPKDAERYARAGLLWCTEKTLDDCLDALAAARLGKVTDWQVATRKYTALFPSIHINLLIAAFQGRTLLKATPTYQ
jgi:hypothetical protein